MKNHMSNCIWGILDSPRDIEVMYWKWHMDLTDNVWRHSKYCWCILQNILYGKLCHVVYRYMKTFGTNNSIFSQNAASLHRIRPVHRPLHVFTTNEQRTIMMILVEWRWQNMPKQSCKSGILANELWFGLTCDSSMLWNIILVIHRSKKSH